MSSHRFTYIVRSILVATGTLDVARKIRSKLGRQLSRKAEKLIENDPEYLARVAAEISTFENDEVVHDLPSIFHYWSNKYLLPTIQTFGFAHPDDFFIKQLVKVIDTDPAERVVFISIGAGNCDTELRVAQGLIALGYDNFSIECLDLPSSTPNGVSY